MNEASGEKRHMYDEGARIIRTSPDMPFVDGDDLFEDDLLNDGL